LLVLQVEPVEASHELLGVVLAGLDLVARGRAGGPADQPADEQADDERDGTDDDGAAPAAGGRDVQGHARAPVRGYDRRPRPPRWRRSPARSRRRRPRSARSGGPRRSPRPWGGG